MFRPINIIILFFLFPVLCKSQIAGYGLLDGVYRFTLTLRESNDSFMEGSIQYEGESTTNQLIATTRGDTLKCQEIDAFINPVSTFLLIKHGNGYHGEWFDENNKSILPASLYISETEQKPLMYARRFDIEINEATNQKIIEVPLSPTVQIGKYIRLEQKEINGFSSNTSFDKRTYYTATGPIDLQSASQASEEIPIESYFFKETDFSIEALIPAFSQAFVDSLQSALVHWKEKLQEQTIPISNQRFPSRYYAICDIDYWIDDLISGSFEYVSPSGDGSGFTFIFDRKDDKFISFDKLIRSGNLSNKLANQKEGLGTTFNLFGIINKDKFNSVKNRNNQHTPWSELNIRLKRKLNDNIR